MNDSHTTYASLGLGGSIASFLPWMVKAFFHTDMPPEVAVSAGTLISGVVGYFLHQVVLKGVTK